MSSAQAVGSASHFFLPVPAATDYFVMNATLPAGEVPEATRRATLTYGKFTLTD